MIGLGLVGTPAVLPGMRTQTVLIGCYVSYQPSSNTLWFLYTNRVGVEIVSGETIFYYSPRKYQSKPPQMGDQIYYQPS